jgi:hypothetical protein
MPFAHAVGFIKEVVVELGFCPLPNGLEIDEFCAQEAVTHIDPDITIADHHAVTEAAGRFRQVQALQVSVVEALQFEAIAKQPHRAIFVLVENRRIFFTHILRRIEASPFPVLENGHAAVPRSPETAFRIPDQCTNPAGVLQVVDRFEGAIVQPVESTLGQG